MSCVNVGVAVADCSACKLMYGNTIGIVDITPDAAVMLVPSTCTTPGALAVAFAMDIVVPDIDNGADAV